MTDPRIERVRAMAEASRPTLSIPPADCSNACMRGPCDCSRVFRARGWDLDPAGVLEILGEPEDQPQEGRSVWVVRAYNEKNEDSWVECWRPTEVEAERARQELVSHWGIDPVQQFTRAEAERLYSVEEVSW